LGWLAFFDCWEASSGGVTLFGFLMSEFFHGPAFFFPLFFGDLFARPGFGVFFSNEVADEIFVVWGAFLVKPWLRPGPGSVMPLA